MVKYYCDLCGSKVTKNDEYSLPMEYETSIGSSTLDGKYYSFSSEIKYLPEKCHLCENCAKIIYLFIQGMKKGEING